MASGASLATVSSQTEQDAVFALTGATGQSGGSLSMWALVLVLYWIVNSFLTLYVLYIRGLDRIDGLPERRHLLLGK